MPSPFPGMNPWLEKTSVWNDFHHTFLQKLRANLVPQVGMRYAVQIEVRLYVHELNSTQERFFAQADVGAALTHGPRGGTGTLTLADAPIATLELPDYQVIRETYLQIMDIERRRVVTVIELLSPTNRDPRSHRAEYLAKRRQILESTTHFVEIDLLRGGLRTVAPPVPASAVVLVSRAAGFRRAEMWAVNLRERLPRIPIPLLPSDAELVVDLQAILHAAYDEAGYAVHIYQQPPDEPLEPADAEWAHELLRLHT